MIFPFSSQAHAIGFGFPARSHSALLENSVHSALWVPPEWVSANKRGSCDSEKLSTVQQYFCTEFMASIVSRSCLSSGCVTALVCAVCPNNEGERRTRNQRAFSYFMRDCPLRCIH